MTLEKRYKQKAIKCRRKIYKCSQYTISQGCDKRNNCFLIVDCYKSQRYAHMTRATCIGQVFPNFCNSRKTLQPVYMWDLVGHCLHSTETISWQTVICRDNRVCCQSSRSISDEKDGQSDAQSPFNSSGSKISTTTSAELRLQ